MNRGFLRRILQDSTSFLQFQFPIFQISPLSAKNGRIYRRRNRSHSRLFQTIRKPVKKEHIKIIRSKKQCRSFIPADFCTVFFSLLILLFQSVFPFSPCCVSFLCPGCLHTLPSFGNEFFLPASGRTGTGRLS